jgi:predicted peroxiredoxin
MFEFSRKAIVTISIIGNVMSIELDFELFLMILGTKYISKAEATKNGGKLFQSKIVNSIILETR